MMLIKTVSSVFAIKDEKTRGLLLCTPYPSSSSSSGYVSFSGMKFGNREKTSGVSVSAISSSSDGVLFEPFEEVKRDSFVVPITSNVSLARHNYLDQCEAAINEQINVEYSASYVYHSMYAYFDRDNVALKGLAKFFKESSEEERGHAEKFMAYQNLRGGRVKLHSLLNTPSEFENVVKGDALYDRMNDVQTTEFLKREFLSEQVEAIKKISDYVTQLRRIGKGHGIWHFNQMLLDEAA